MRVNRIGRLAAGGLVAGLALTACSAPADDPGAAGGEPPAEASEPSATSTPEPPPELPRGGRELFPKYRLVGYSGVKGDLNYDLGRLAGNLNEKCTEIEELGAKYARKRELLPVYEMITVVVHGTPQADGSYNSRRPKKEVREYLEAARKCKGILLLNIQPGRSEFLPELKYYEDILKEPDVGVALDPEWAMDPGKIPNIDLGRSTGPEMNKTAKYLSRIVRENDLPEKALVFHQFNFDAVENVDGLKPQEGVALIRSVDGLGGPQAKRETYNALMKDNPDYIHAGFKIFFKEDANPPWGSRIMTAREVLKLKPKPEYVLFE